MIDEFLNLFFAKGTLGKISLRIDVEEGGGTAKRHGSAVLLLYGSEIGKVGPLDGFLHIAGRT